MFSVFAQAQLFMIGCTVHSPKTQGEGDHEGITTSPENKCGVCHSNKHQCSCSERPQKKKTVKSSSTNDNLYSELREMYDSFQKDHERLGLAFENQERENEELTKEMKRKRKRLNSWQT